MVRSPVQTVDCTDVDSSITKTQLSGPRRASSKSGSYAVEVLLQMIHSTMHQTKTQPTRLKSNDSDRDLQYDATVKYDVLDQILAVRSKSNDSDQEDTYYGALGQFSPAHQNLISRSKSTACCYSEIATVLLGTLGSATVAIGFFVVLLSALQQQTQNVVRECLSARYCRQSSSEGVCLSTSISSSSMIQQHLS